MNTDQERVPCFILKLASVISKVNRFWHLLRFRIGYWSYADFRRWRYGVMKRIFGETEEDEPKFSPEEISYIKSLRAAIERHDRENFVPQDDYITHGCFHRYQRLPPVRQ